MRLTSIVAILLLCGCGSVTPMAELERLALQTGDWSAVEQRERMLLRRKASPDITCPKGLVAVCRKDFGKQTCGCLDRSAFWSAFSY